MIQQPGGADLLGMQKQINMQPDPILQKLVASKQPGASMLAAIALDARNKMRAQSQLPQAQQQAQQPTVAQRVVQQASPGLPSLPTGQAIPQQYAAGGIVRGYAGGGGIQYSPGTFLPPVYDPEYKSGSTTDPSVGEAERAQWARYIEAVSKGIDPVVAAGMDVATLIPRGLMGAVNAGVISPARALGMNVPYMKDVLAPEGNRFESATPWYDRYRAGQTGQPVSPEVAPSQTRPSGMVYGERSTGPAAPSAPPPPATRSSGGASGGIASVAPASFVKPEFVDTRAGAPAARMSDAEWTAFVEKKRKELELLYGPSYADRYIAELEKERADIKAREPRSQQEAWLTAGLRMMQGKSRHGLQNIGAGGEAGIAQYRADRSQADEQLRALRREMQGLEATKQQRGDQILQAGIGRADAENAAMAQARAEAIRVGEARNTYNVNVAELMVKNRMADAAMINAYADIEKAKAMASANQDAKMMNAITTAEKRIDAAVKVRLAGNQMLAMDEKAYAAAYNKAWIEEREKELNSNPYFAKAMGVGSNSIDASSFGLGKK